DFQSRKFSHAWHGSACRPRSTPTKSRQCHSNRSRKPVEGGVGPVAGVSAAWMPRPSPQGRVYGVPRNRTHPAIPRNERWEGTMRKTFKTLLLALPLCLAALSAQAADSAAGRWKTIDDKTGKVS